jgi:hypothetical protein
VVRNLDTLPVRSIVRIKKLLSTAYLVATLTEGPNESHVKCVMERDKGHRPILQSIMTKMATVQIFKIKSENVI